MWKKCATMLLSLLLLSSCGGGEKPSVVTEGRTVLVSPTVELEAADSIDDAEPAEQGGVIHLASRFDVTGLEDVMTAFHDKYPEWTV